MLLFSASHNFLREKIGWRRAELPSIDVGLSVALLQAALTDANGDEEEEEETVSTPVAQEQEAGPDISAMADPEAPNSAPAMLVVTGPDER